MRDHELAAPDQRDVRLLAALESTEHPVDHALGEQDVELVGDGPGRSGEPMESRTAADLGPLHRLLDPGSASSAELWST
jgi:hypothetical protein